MAMARRVIVQTRTELDDTDRARIAQEIGARIQAECAQAQRAIEQGVWNNLNIGLADAGDWGMILADVMRKDILTVEEIRERVGRLDTAARSVWWDVLDEIEQTVN
jgi:hypothetical protein